MSLMYGWGVHVKEIIARLLTWGMGLAVQAMKTD
jgi:hypothetical protein